MDLKAQVVKSRSSKIASEEVGDEVVVYDLETDDAHLLSPNTARVWKAADGTRRVDQLLEVVVADTPEQAELVVWEALSELQNKALLDGVVLVPGARFGMSRRAMLKRIGIAAIAIPVITTIVAPTPAAAACAPGRGNYTEPCCSAGTCTQGTCTSNPNTNGRGTICCAPSGTSGGTAGSGGCGGNTTNNAPAPNCCSGQCGNGNATAQGVCK